MTINLTAYIARLQEVIAEKIGLPSYEDAQAFEQDLGNEPNTGDMFYEDTNEVIVVYTDNDIVYLGGINPNN